MIGEHIKNLQHKPYAARVRALWIAVGIVAVIVLGLWLLTLKFRPSPLNKGEGEAPRQIWDTLRQVKQLKFK